MTDKPTPQVAAALAEIENAERLGDEERVRGARKVLAAAGYEEAAEQRAAAADGDSDHARRSTPPKNRQSRQDAKGSTA